MLGRAKVLMDCNKVPVHALPLYTTPWNWATANFDICSSIAEVQHYSSLFCIFHLVDFAQVYRQVAHLVTNPTQVAVGHAKK